MIRAPFIACAVGITALAVYSLALAPELTPREVDESEIAYQPTDHPWLQLAAAHRGSVDGVSASAALARAWARVPGAPNLNALSGVLAAVAAASLSLLVTHLVGGVAGATAGLGWLASPAVLSIAIAAGGTLGPQLVVAVIVVAIAGLIASARDKRRPWLAIAIVALAAAAAEDLSVALMGSLAVAATGWRSSGRLVSLGAGLLVLVVGATTHVADFHALSRAARETGPMTLGPTWGALFRWGLVSSEPLATQLTTRCSILVTAITANVGVMGWVVALLGVRWRAPVLLAVGGILLPAVAPFPGPWEPSTQMLLPLALLWALIGSGVARIASWGPTAKPVARALAVVLPVLQAGRSVAASDTMVDRAAGEMLASFSRQHAGATAIVLEDARSGRLLLWANQRRGRDRWELLPQDGERLRERARAGEPLLATQGAAARVALLGLTGPPLEVGGRTLPSLLESIDPRALVGLVASPGVMAGHPEERRAVDALASGKVRFDRNHEAVALFARRLSGVAHVTRGDAGVVLAAGPHVRSDVDPALNPAVDTRLAADATGARVDVADRELGSIDRGALVVWWSPIDGRLEWAPFDAGQGLTAPWQLERWSLSQLQVARACMQVDSAEWQDLAAAVPAGRLGVRMGPGAGLRMYLAHERALLVRGAGFPGRLPPATVVVPWDRADAQQARAAADAMAADGVEPGAGPGNARFIWQVTIAASPREPGAFALGLGGTPKWARARATPGGADTPVHICGGAAGERLFAQRGMREQSLSLADPDSFAAGWLPLERSASERWRQLGEAGGELLVRLDVPQEVEVAVTARTDPGTNGRAGLTLHVNDVDEGDRPIAAGLTTYRWRVPAERWQPGTNRLLLQSAAGAGITVRFLVTDVRFRR